MSTGINEPLQSKKAAIKKGALAGFPIFLGYLPIAIAYGVLAMQSGLTIFETTMMSVLVFAGASQFMAANMIAQGALLIQVVIATFVLNFRHFIMSMSFMNKAKHFPMRWKLLLSVGLTDETFAVSSLHGEEAKKSNGVFFYVTMFLVAYFSWVFGSLLGALIGDLLPAALSESMGIALYAMFIGLLIPSVKKEWKLGLIAFISMMINFLLIKYLGFQDEKEGWAIVIATLVGSSFGIVMLKEDEV
ncbi:AzlC family ABC transporter permease [Bacillaceae bacterium W0354]